MAQVKNVQRMTMNDFSIVRVIGEGAYGRAILCKSKKDNNNLVVIKEIALSNMSAQEQREAWKETKVLSLLNHPNIISYKGSFMQNNKLHIVMDYADGGDLFAQIQKAKSNHFKEEQILEWFVQICLALKHIHDRKILHRDIKCQNIFLMKNGIVKMGDFGIAKILDHTTQLSKTAIGTPYYLSPEICQGKAYNNKSDVWSLGCVLYELCTLQHAFDSKCMNGLIMKILRSKQNPIPYFYSQNLRNLVDSLLQKQPNKRPSINQILKLDFIHSRIDHLLSETIKKIEFSHTVFHHVTGGETPAMYRPESNMGAAPNANDKKQNDPPAPAPQAAAAPKIIERPKQNNPTPLDKPKIAPPGRPPAQNEIPKMQQRPPPKMQKGLPVNLNPQKPAPKPSVPSAQAQVKQFKPKAPRELERPPSKDELLARKNAMVLQERQIQKEAREKREREEKEAEDRANKKRAEIMEKRAQREAERKAQMKHLQQEAREMKKKYDNLEAPFKKAMGGMVAPKPAAKPSKPSHYDEPPQRHAGGGDRPLPKYRESYFDDDDDDMAGAYPSDDAPKPADRPKPKLPSKQPTIRPDRVRNREEEQRSLREMMAKRRAELRAQKLAEKKEREELEAKVAALQAQQAQQAQAQPEPKAQPPPQPKPQPAPQPKPEPAQQALAGKPGVVKEVEKPAPPPSIQAKPEPIPNKTPPTSEPKAAPAPAKPAPAPAPAPVENVERPTRLEDLINLSDTDTDGDDDNDIISLAAIVKNILDNPPTSSDEDQEEEESQEKKEESNPPGVFIFSGKELKLPMVTDNDSLHYRIEALRQFIEQNLGLDKFIQVYNFITIESDNMTEEEGGSKVKEILKDENDLQYYPLIQQLVFCEESL